MKKSKILLFGTGSMAYEYVKVLIAQGHNILVIGRGKKSAKTFQEKSGIAPITGGADKFLAQSNYQDWKAIVAVTGDQLGAVCLSLIKHGIKSILLEKPGGLDKKEIELVAAEAEKNSVEIFIGYNRRFYTSVKKAQELIKKDGGVLSFHFDFTEVAATIVALPFSKEIKKQWILHNSSHVFDLAFFLAGTPKSLTAHTYDSLPWHPVGAIFTGCGITQQDTPFTYHANWKAPGRWGLEVMTKNHRLIFRPLEKLHAQKHGSFNILNIELNDKIDTEFKAGVFKEVEAFLTDKKVLCTIDEHCQNLFWYNKIQKSE